MIWLGILLLAFVAGLTEGSETKITILFWINLVLLIFAFPLGVIMSIIWFVTLVNKE